MIEPKDVVDAADVAYEQLSSFVDSDWSVRAGPLEWDVQQTIAHMISGPAKYTLYLASESMSFIALTLSQWPNASQREILESIRPVAIGLAAVARWLPREAQAFHSGGATDVGGFLAMACVEMLVHADDVLRGLGSRLDPPTELTSRVLDASYPATKSHRNAWQALLLATGRPAT